MKKIITVCCLALLCCGGGRKATAAEPKPDLDEPARLCLQRATDVIVGVAVPN